CHDDDKSDTVDVCSPSERWRDNPREALKGLPVLVERFDDSGHYLDTRHTLNRLRRLYVGLDGREVHDVVAIQSDAFVYDIAANLSTSTRHLSSVEIELVPGTTVDAQDLALDVAVRASAGTAELKRRAAIDYFGNVTQSIDYGCIGGSA